MGEAVSMLRRVVAWAAVCAAAVCALSAATPASAHAGAVDKVLFEGTPSTAMTTSVNSYDVTGDKKTDEVKIWLTPTDSGDASESLNISVNGKVAKTLSGQVAAQGYYAKVRLLKLANSAPLIYVQYTGNNADGYYTIYKYKDGKLSALASASDMPLKYAAYHRHIESVKVVGNRLNVVYEFMSYSAGSLCINYELKYSNGKLIRTSNTAKDVFFSFGGKHKTLTAAQPIQLYTTSSTSVKKSRLATGTKLKLTSAYLKAGKLSLKVKTSSGKTGWMKAATESTDRASSGTCFKETFLAG